MTEAVHVRLSQGPPATPIRFACGVTEVPDHEVVGGVLLGAEHAAATELLSCAERDFDAGNTDVEDRVRRVLAAADARPDGWRVTSGTPTLRANRGVGVPDTIVRHVERSVAT